jgi:hypothetical protein
MSRLISFYIKTLENLFREYADDVAGNGGDMVTPTGIGCSLQLRSPTARTESATTHTTYRTESCIL